MLKAVLLLAGLMLAVAFVAPGMLERAAQGPSAQAARPAEKSPLAAAVDDGGLVRLQADRAGHYFTRIEVNNRPLQALVDTGATFVALRYEDARSMGLINSGDKFDVGVRTANGDGRARRVTLRSITVDTITIREVEALVLEQGALNVNLLGMSFLKRLARFEVQRGQLVLER
jgi:aspartyl protease family protein